jgi:hypothetical protein
VLAVGLARLGMAGGRLAAMGTTGPLEGDEAADDLLGLAAPDALLLTGPDREGEAGIAHRAGRTDGDGFSLELWGVGEERVVLGRDDIAAGGFITPAVHLGHAAVPSFGHLAPAVRLAWRALTAARERRAK